MARRIAGGVEVMPKLVKRMSCIISIGLCAVVSIGMIVFIYQRRQITETKNFLKEVENLSLQIQDNRVDHNAMDTLKSYLHSDDRYERAIAAATMGKLGPRAAEAVPDLIEILSSGEAYSAREAARALGRVGPGAAAAAPALRNAVDQFPNQDIGWFAASSLGLVAPLDDQSSADCLERASHSPVEQMRDYASVGRQNLEKRRLNSTTLPTTSDRSR